MSKKEKKVNINFGISKISILDYCIESSKINIDPSETIKFTFNFELGFGINREKETLNFLLNIKAIPQSQGDIVVGFLKTEMQFFIKNIEKFLLSDEPKIDLPDMFMATLVGLVISTSRGIWASKVMGTKLESIIMPLVDPNELLKNLKV